MNDIAMKIIVLEFSICVLLMFASEKIGHYVGVPFGRYKAAAARYAQVSLFTLGAVWALLMASLFVTFTVMIYLSS